MTRCAAARAAPSSAGPLPALAVLIILCLGLFATRAQALVNAEDLRDLLPEALHQVLFGNDAAYLMQFQGEFPAGMEDILQSVSETFALRRRPPATPEMLERRVRSDIPLMQRALRSEGYYGGRIEARVDHEASPPLVIFQVSAGPPYLLETVLFEGLCDGEDCSLPEPGPDSAGLVPGQPARAPEIDQGQAKVRDFLREHGRPFATVGLGKVVVDHASATVTVHYAVDPGPMARFGPVLIEGLERVKPQYVMDKIPWTEGQTYQASLLNTLRSRLMRDGLFIIVNASHPETPWPDASLEEEGLPVTVTLVERVPRTVKAGASYESDRGLGIELSWEHRNLRGQAERLRTRLVLAEKEQRIAADYRMPNFLDERQSLEFSTEILQEETDAYDKKSVAVGAFAARQISPAWSAGLGARYRLSETTQFDRTQTYGLFSTPGELAWDMRNDVLDPTRGWRAVIRAEPYIDTLEASTRFFKLFGGLSAYVPLLPADRAVLAARGGMGSIMGEPTRNLPPDERFYAGGGGSIRGYAYQSIGPEEDGKVVGGRSMVESSLELRLRMENNFGLVAFLDGGQVFPDSSLQWEDDFYWGAGLGIRYFTDFAPIRLDVGFPLNKRKKDDSFQLYVSIGQAF